MSRRRRRIRFNSEHVAARVIVVLAGIGGVMVGGHSTGWIVTDRVVAGLFAALIAFATSRARRWSWLVLSGAAVAMTLSADENLATAMAVWALALALVSVVLDKRDRAIGALIGGLSIQALLRIRGFGDSGVSAGLTALATLAPLLSAYRRMPSTSHRRVVRGTLIAAGVAALFLVPVAIGALLARSKIEHGISEVRAGFTAAEHGDKPGARQHFRNAETNFAKARTFVDSWWAKPALIVPGGGLQAGVLAVATHEGDSLAGVAATLADTEEAALSVEDGTISIDAVARLAGPLAQARAALGTASSNIDDVRSSFLLPPLADRVDLFADEVDKALPAAENAQAAIQVAPDMLGSSAPRRYLVLFTTPAETRGVGGFVGSWALLTIDKGHVDLTDSGKISELNNKKGPYDLTGPERYLAAYGDSFHPERFFQNITASPDFPDVGAVAAQLAPQTKLGQPVDGVVLLDPIALASMLRFTGPLKVPGLKTELNAQNAAQTLLFDQYALFPDRGGNNGEEQPGVREDFLADTLKATFDALLHRHLPGPEALVNVLGPMVEQRRLMTYSTHPAEQALFASLKMDGAFPPPDTGDFFSLVTTNRGGNKLDAYLHRDVTYDVTYSPSTGVVQATATVVLHNDAPPSGLPFEVGYNDDDLPIGTNQTALTLYTPLSLTGLTADGQPLGVVSQSELGYRSYTAYLDLAPQSSQTLVFTLTGSSAPAAAYRVRVEPQPLVNPDTVGITITAADGWRPQSAAGITAKGTSAHVRVDPAVANDRSVTFR